MLHISRYDWSGQNKAGYDDTPTNQQDQEGEMDSFHV